MTAGQLGTKALLDTNLEAGSSCNGTEVTTSIRFLINRKKVCKNDCLSL